MGESNIDVLAAAEDCFASENSFASLARFKRNRLSRSQFGLIVDYMTLNPELIRGKTFATSKEEWTRKWDELTALLNADWTGAKRDVHRWKKAWFDQKKLLRRKAAKRDECIALTGSDDMFKLTELEERVLKMINEAEESSILHDKMEAPKSVQKTFFTHSPKNNLNTHIIKNIPSQIIPPSGYIVLGVGPDNIPVSLQHINQSSSNMGTANVLIGLEPQNIIVAGLQPSSDVPKKAEQTIISDNAATASELNKSQNKSDNELNLKNVDNCSEMQTEVEEWREKDKSSLIHKSQPYEVSKAIENSSTSDSSQSLKTSEKTVNGVNSSIQNPSVSSCAKKRKLSHKSLLIRRNEFTVTKLLQKQNELLEGISATLTRIEKSVKDKSSVEVQGKNKMLTNISENIDMLAESLGTVSKSLKAIADN